MTRCSTSNARTTGMSATAALASVLCVAALLAVTAAQANTARKAVAAKSNARGSIRPAPAAAAPRGDVPVVAVQSTAPGQAGYVHYFVVTGPDGVAINHVAIELPGDLIAHSFPDDGVSIAPFIKQGAMTTSAGTVYQVEHLYGLKPFADDGMRALQRDLDARVQPWVEARTPYCDELTPSAEQCVSCLSFAMSVLYPNGLPRDFKGAQKGLYTTDDLLLYLAGVPPDATREARARRIAALGVPDALREELARISAEVEVARAADAAAPLLAGERRPVVIDPPRRSTARRRS